MSEFRFFNRNKQKELAEQNRRKPLYHHDNISPKIINVQPPQRPTGGSGRNSNGSK